MTVRQDNGAPKSEPWAREAYVAVIGIVLGVALVIGLTEDMGRRVCGGAGSIPGAAILFGCDH